MLTPFVVEVLKKQAQVDDKTKTRAFMNELLQSGKFNPFDERFIYWSLRGDDGTEGVVMVQIYPIGGSIHFASIHTTPKEFRGKGAAKHVMDLIMKLADKHGLPIDLEAKPFDKGTGGMNKSQLTSWYKSFGFKPHLGGMIRKPV